jgi:hypothetical protein
VPTPWPRATDGKLGGFSAPEAGYPNNDINSWDVLHSTSHVDANHAGAPSSASSGVIRRAQLVNTGYGSRPDYINPVDNVAMNNLYKKVYDQDNVVIYCPIQKVMDLSTPCYVVIRGTSTLFDYVKDLNIFLDWSSNNYLSALLAGFYQEVENIAQRIREHVGARRWEMTSHSLGCKYSLAVWHKMKTDQTYSTVLAQLHRSYCFNPYVMRSTEYKALQEADQAEQHLFQFHIISGDFASILLRNNPPEDSSVFIYEAVDMTHETSDYSLYNTLTHFLSSPQFSNPTRDEWLSVSSHSMSNFTPASAQPIYSPLQLDEHVIIRTQHTGSLPHYGIATAQPLYMVSDGKLDYPISGIPVSELHDFQPLVQVPDETTYTVQDVGGTLYALFNVTLTYTTSSGDVTTGPIGYTYHGVDANTGETLLRFGNQNEDLTIGTRLRIPSPTYGTYTLPTSIIEDDIAEYSQNVDNGDAYLYNFIATPAADVAWHSNRRAHEAFNPAIVGERCIRFTWNSVIDGFDTYDIEFALYDTGSGNLKWGHVDVGDYDNYKVVLEHISADLYSVKSNTWDGTYTPAYEVISWDGISRYLIRHTTEINGTRYLKRPTPDYTYLNQTSNIMVKNNTPIGMLDMQWEEWDGITGSPTEFLFDIKPFAELQIPRALTELSNNVDGTRHATYLLYPQYLRSPNGDYVLIIERNGNLTVYSSTSSAHGGSHTWDSATYNTGNGLLIQTDGNMIIWGGGSQYDTDSPYLWFSATGPGQISSSYGYDRVIKVSDTGKFEIYDGSSNLIKEYP